MDQIERRRHRRIPLSVALAPRVELVDISVAGAQMEVPWPVTLRSVVQVPLQLVIRALPRPVEYQVVHVRPAPRAGRFRVHGRFIEPIDEQVLHDSLRTLSPS
jgi:hypothetical protein